MGCEEFNKHFNGLAGRYDEIMSLRGDYSPEANDRIFEIVKTCLVTAELFVYDSPDGPSDSYRQQMLVANAGLKALLNNSTAGIKRFGEVVTQSGQLEPEESLWLIRSQFGSNYDITRVATPDIRDIAETLIGQLKDKISASDFCDNKYDNRLMVDAVSDLARRHVVSTEVSDDFKELSIMVFQRKAQLDSNQSPSTLEHS